MTLQITQSEFARMPDYYIGRVRNGEQIKVTDDEGKPIVVMADNLEVKQLKKQIEDWRLRWNRLLNAIDEARKGHER